MRSAWTATPRTQPDVVAKRTATGVSVYVSWNGATTVARWQVLAKTATSAMKPVATAARRGFETRIDVAGSATAVAVRALDSRGRVLATSRNVPIP